MEGYFCIEVNNVVIVPNEPPEKDLKLKLTAEIVNGLDVFKFTKTNETKYTGNDFTLIKQSNADDGSTSLICGFENLLLRSNFIDLNNEVLNVLANTSVVVCIMMLNEASAALPAKAAKGAAVAPPPPAEEPLIEVTISLAELLSKQGGILQFDRPLSEYAQSTVRRHAMVNTTLSALNFQASIDNDLAEYVLGARVISWSGAQLSKPPHPWALHAPDVPDPKAKVQPSAADLRAKYLENIGKLIETQSKVSSFTFSIGGNDDDTNPADLNETAALSVMDSVRKLFPALSLADGKITFDKEKALTIPAEEDIRVRGDLWTVTWASSPLIFFHRNEVRRLTAWITADPQHSFLPLTVRKVPTAESVAVEGGELFATALLDLSLALEPGRSDFSIGVSLIGELMDSETEPERQPSCSVFMTIQGGPLVLIPALQTLKGMTSPVNGKKTPKAILSQQPSNRDALQELRDEISSCLERLAQEYVSLYPKPLIEQVEVHNQQQPGDKRDQASLLDEQKTDFVTYLTNHGLFHDLQQKLQPKILLIIQERYGPRGRALGKSEVLKSYDTRQQQPQTEDKVSEDRELMQKVLSELYAFLLTECNVVLNSMFTKTVIQKEQQEVENPARIIDTQESEKQRHERLYREAEDIFASGDIVRAETVHLERLQFLDRSFTLNQDPQSVHDAFVQYAVFLLQSASLLLYRGDVDGYQPTMRRAREALTIAAGSLGDVWETSLLQACALLEANQPELGEEVLHKTLALQLQQDDNHTGYDLNSFDDLSGYESDQLCPVHPRCYAILAAHCHIQQRPLLVRKALLLANRCYEESSESTANHGQPRRTMVLIMAEASIFLSKHGFRTLSSAALALAVDCERAGTAKAQAKGKAALTPPRIRFLLKKAVAMNSWNSSDTSDGEVAAQCTLVATDSVFDLIDAKVVEGDAFARPTSLQPDRALDAYLVAVETAMANVDISTAITKQVIPVRVFVTMGRLLLAAGEFQHATKILLYALQLYTSPSLCLLLGIAYLRLDKLEEAEQALLEANMLDNRHADVWAYLAIVCIARGVNRVPEAEQHLFQALRLDQKDAIILREVALAFMSVDKLQIAEDLMRRTLAVSASRGSNPYHRKLLADILAGQNLAAKAVDEYMAVLQDESLEDVGEKLRAGQKCVELMKTLGRAEEIPALNQIISKLGSAVNGEDIM